MVPRQRASLASGPWVQFVIGSGRRLFTSAGRVPIEDINHPRPGGPSPLCRTKILLLATPSAEAAPPGGGCPGKGPPVCAR